MPDNNFYKEQAAKKRDFPVLILTSMDSCVVYSHAGTGPRYEEVFSEFKQFHGKPFGESLLASLTDSDRKAFQNWIDILHDETYVELMMHEDIMKLCPSFSLTWTDGQNYEVRFEAIKTEKIYEFVLAWLQPHGQTQQQRLAGEIIELMSELRKAPKEVINNLRDYLPEVRDTINLANYSDVEDSLEFLTQLSRHLHAAKGTTFFMGFMTLGNAFHETESRLDDLKGSWALSDGLQPIQEGFSQLYLLLNLAEGIIAKVYETHEEMEEGTLSIRLTEYYKIVEATQKLFDAFKRIASPQNELSHLVDELYHGLIRFDAISITTMFEQLNSSTAQLSKELNKAVTFAVSSNIPTIHLPHKLFDSLWNALYQVLKNSIDHGVEPKEERRSVHKSVVAQVLLSVLIEGDWLVISLKDDGRGLNSDTLVNSALKRGLISEEKARELIEGQQKDAIYSLLFIPGFSTQQKVTTISGRGVGTDVIKKEVEGYGGTAKIDSVEGQWTEFTLRYPIVVNHILIE